MSTTYPASDFAKRILAGAITKILNDERDEPLRNKAIRVALEVLKHAPGLRGSPEELMMTSLARYAGNSYVACSLSHNTVLFLGKDAIVLSNDNLDHVPWVNTDKMSVPDMSFFKARVRLEDGLSAHLLDYIQSMMRDERLAAEAALAHAGDEHEDDECSAPAP